MAAIGSSVRISPSFTRQNCNATSDADFARAPMSFRRLSFSSSSSNLFGEKAIASGTKSVPRGRRRLDSRKPLIVSPKAVSDSQNSQTCLDPDASRVSYDPDADMFPIFFL